MMPTYSVGFSRSKIDCRPRSVPWCHLSSDVLADRWGGCPLADGPRGQGGKVVWFELS